MQQTSQRISAFLRTRYVVSLRDSSEVCVRVVIRWPLPLLFLAETMTSNKEQQTVGIGALEAVIGKLGLMRFASTVGSARPVGAAATPAVSVLSLLFLVSSEEGMSSEV